MSEILVQCADMPRICHAGLFISEFHYELEAKRHVCM
jgi:hypothetical protein